MSKPSIEVKNLSKTYRISHLDRVKAEHRTLRDDLVDMAKKPLQMIGGYHGTHKEEFRALNDVSFNVERGEVLGVVGKNGSGKSTLFKILAGITQPTSGEAIIRGRVSSLLEVGSGFHVELTGRENVYFNGAILGMSKAEIDKKFERIVAFSEIEKFIDTPVKFYSSGMKSRLGFAVAANLDPEVFLVDEVLAVGDMEFKLKCIKKMQEIASQDRTVLFVSHIMGRVKQLCKHGILLRNGELVMSGDIDDIAEKYLGDLQADSAVEDEDDIYGTADDSLTAMPLSKRTDAKGTGSIQFVQQKITVSQTEKIPETVIEVVMKNTTDKLIEDMQLNIVIKTRDGDMVGTLSNVLDNDPITLEPNQEVGMKVTARLQIAPGEYLTRLVAVSNEKPKVVYASLSKTGKIIIPDYEQYLHPIEKVNAKTGPYLPSFDFTKLD